MAVKENLTVTRAQWRKENAFQTESYPDYRINIDEKGKITSIEKLERLEAKIQLKYEENRISAIEEAEQEIMMAEHAVADIEKKLSDNKKKVAMFSKRFSELESLQGELTQLRTLYNRKKEELVALEIKSTSDIIQVKVWSPIRNSLKTNLNVLINIS